jgi:hypothetical protein
LHHQVFTTLLFEILFIAPSASQFIITISHPAQAVIGRMTEIGIVLKYSVAPQLVLRASWHYTCGKINEVKKG